MVPSNGFDARLAVMEGNVTHVTPAERWVTVEDKFDLILQALIEHSSDCNPMDSHHHHAGKNVSLSIDSTALSHTDVHYTTVHTYNVANLQGCNSGSSHGSLRARSGSSFGESVHTFAYCVRAPTHKKYQIEVLSCSLDETWGAGVDILTVNSHSSLFQFRTHSSSSFLV